MTAVQIRAVRPAEYDVVGELTAVTYSAEGYGSPAYESALRDVRSRDATATVLVALVDQTVLGAVTVVTAGGPWSELAAPDEAEIRMLVVSPAARRRGVGEALVQACITQARTDGCRLVRLSTEPTMQGAHRIYERLGFTRTPERDWSPVAGVDLLTYCLELT